MNRRWRKLLDLPAVELRLFAELYRQLQSKNTFDRLSQRRGHAAGFSNPFRKAKRRILQRAALGCGLSRESTVCTPACLLTSRDYRPTTGQRCWPQQRSGGLPGLWNPIIITANEQAEYMRVVLQPLLSSLRQNRPARTNI